MLARYWNCWGWGVNKVILAITNDEVQLPIAIFLRTKDAELWAGRRDITRCIKTNSLDYKNNCRYIRVYI